MTIRLRPDQIRAAMQRGCIYLYLPVPPSIAAEQAPDVFDRLCDEYVARELELGSDELTVTGVIAIRMLERDHDELRIRVEVQRVYADEQAVRAARAAIGHRSPAHYVVD